MADAIAVIIPAAGSGKRLGGISKPLIDVGGRPIILRLLDLFSSFPGVGVICVAVPAGEMSTFRKIAAASGAKKIMVVEGGAARAVSVKRAFDAVRDSLSDGDLVCVHDAARPLLHPSDLGRVIDACRKHDAALLAVRVKDTLKQVDGEGFCRGTIDRGSLYAAQTPQVIRKSLLSKAYDRARDLAGLTDEIMLLEGIGKHAFVVEPEHPNFKVTTPEDLDILRKLIS